MVNVNIVMPVGVWRAVGMPVRMGVCVIGIVIIVARVSFVGVVPVTVVGMVFVRTWSSLISVLVCMRRPLVAMRVLIRPVCMRRVLMSGIRVRSVVLMIRSTDVEVVVGMTVLLVIMPDLICVRVVRMIHVPMRRHTVDMGAVVMP